MNLPDIENYTDEMTISQVIRFFERRGTFFTKTMIQNYVKVNVLPPPLNKRYYSKNHLILLSFIDHFKSVYSLEEIKAIFSLIEIPALYSDFLLSYAKQTKDISNLVSDSQNQSAKNALPLLMLICQPSLIKQEVTNILNISQTCPK